MQNNQKPCLFYLKIISSPNQQIDRYWNLLSPERKKRIKSLGPDQRTILIGSELIVRILACNHLNINNSEIVFGQNSYGKPYIIGYPNFQFNVSHSENLLVVLVSDQAVGVDVEKIRNPNIQIVNRFFTENEKDYVLSNPSLTTKRFYEIWTRKEAYIKYLGKGLSHPLLSFDVLKEHGDNFFTFELDQYIISAFSDNKVIPPYPIKQIFEDELIMALASINKDQKQTIISGSPLLDI